MASQVLRRLRDRGLLVKQGSGSRTYYTLRAPVVAPDLHPEQVRVPFDNEPPFMESNKLATLPPELATLLLASDSKLNREALRDLIVKLCAWQPLTGEQLATLLNKDRHYLRNKHLTPMVGSGQLSLLYPESAKHPNQAYVAPEQDKGKNEPRL